MLDKAWCAAEMLNVAFEVIPGDVLERLCRALPTVIEALGMTVGDEAL